MRTRRNEGLTLDSSENALPSRAREGPGEGMSAGDGFAGSDSPSPNPSRRREGNDRSCILTRERADPATLVRLALSPDGQVLPDVRGKAPGRGAWVGVTKAALETAIASGKLRGALQRAFKGAPLAVPADLPDLVAAALERNALDRLGLEARAGSLLTGAERIETAARSGQLHALYHAADAGADGAGKLAQAWRVGRDEEGSGRKGLSLPVGRPILSLALGRENVVHIGVTDRAAAKRVGDALDRWLHFIGANSGLRQSTALMETSLPSPCETASQGASAPGSPPAPVGRGLIEDFE